MINFFGTLRTKNQVLFALVISVAIVSVWRGIWGLMDFYLYPQDPVMSYGLSVVIGTVILVATGLFVEEMT